jgi:hypothetical protein
MNEQKLESQGQIETQMANASQPQPVTHNLVANQPLSINFNIFKQNVRNLKAIQKTRIQIGNGIYGTMIEELLRNSPHLKEIQMLRRDKEADKKKTARLIKKALTELNIDEPTATKLYKQAKDEDLFYKDLVKIETNGTKKYLEPALAQMPIYTGYLANIKGLGALTSAQLIAIIGDITRFRNPSSLCTYFGVGDPTKSKLVHGVQANWNTKAKALLLGVIGTNFLRQHSQYKVVYDRRAEFTKRTKPEIWHLDANGNKAKGKNMHPKHGYKDGIRVMMKRFLKEYFVAGYEAKGLIPPADPWILTQPNHNHDPQIVKYKPIVS